MTICLFTCSHWEIYLDLRCSAVQRALGFVLHESAGAIIKARDDVSEWNVLAVATRLEMRLGSVAQLYPVRRQLFRRQIEEGVV